MLLQRYEKNFIKLQKPQFEPILARKPQLNIFPKKSFRSILRLYVAVTSCKNSENATLPFFIKLEKPCYGSILGPLGTKTSKHIFSRETDLRYFSS